MPVSHDAPDYDLVVIGGGAAGLVIASGAAQLGRRVALIDRGPNLGGDCLHTGCVPSKALIHAASVMHGMRTGANLGLPAVDAEVDLGSVMDRVHAVIASIQVHDDPQRFRDYGVDVRFGDAVFEGAHTLRVGEDHLRGQRIVIATGSRASIPPIPGLQELPCLTNETIFNLRELPKRLAVIGAGAVGLELGQALARLGSKVTLFEAAEAVMPQSDQQQVEVLLDALQAEGLSLYRNCQLQSVQAQDAGYRLTWVGETLDVDAVLVAAGRTPNVEGLDLDKAGVQVGQHGVEVDSRMRTSVKHIYACGDVCGPFPFTHMAEYQAGIVIANAVFRLPKKASYRVVPKVVYTAPEFAEVGLTEQQASQQGLRLEVLTFPYAQVDRAITQGETQGQLKVVLDGKKIVGASIVGSQAGELIAEFALAIQKGMTIADISGVIHAYPTMAQANRRVVNQYYGSRLFTSRTRSLVRWMNRLLP